MNMSSEIERTIEEIRNMRLRYDLSHVIFAFPRTKMDTDEEWTDPSPCVAGCIGGAQQINLPPTRDHPYTVKGITQIEFEVTKPNRERLMKLGVFTITRHKSGFRITLPTEIREMHGRSVIAIVGVPPFHRGSTPRMEIILQMQRTCRNMSDELLPRDKWLSLSKRRINELRNSQSIRRKDIEDARLHLWMEQDQKCASCGRQIRIDQATLEHELPKGMHGPNTMTNLSITCAKCNNQKGNSLPFGLTSDDSRLTNYTLSNGLIIPRSSISSGNEGWE